MCFLISHRFPWIYQRKAREQRREKYLLVRTHCCWGKLPRKEQKNENYQQLLQIQGQMSLPLVWYFPQKNDRLERLWNNSQNLKDHTPLDKAQKLTIFGFWHVAFQHSVTAWTLRKIFSIRVYGKVCFRNWMGVIVNLLTVRHFK